ncbi:MAG: hypothetical protein AB7R40_22495 [Nitrospiraceae bacterium]
MTANKDLSQSLAANLSRQELYFQYGVNSAVLWGMVMLPLIPASLSFSAIVSRFPEMLHIPGWLAYIVAGFTAAGIEFLGLSAVKLALRMRKYNLKIADTDFEQAPLGQGVIIATAYLITVVMLTVFLKVFPHMAIWSLLPLAGMGALADWLIALQSDHNDRESHYDRATDDAETEQEQAAVITALTADIDQLRATIADQIDQAIEHITAQLTVQFEKSLADQIDQLTSDYNQRIEQLLDQLHTQDTKQSAQSEQITTLPIIRIDHQPVHPAGANLYTNGHIADDTDHLSLDDKIRAVAQRMLDAGQKVNKSEIARILGCSRTTVNNVLG